MPQLGSCIGVSDGGEREAAVDLGDAVFAHENLGCFVVCRALIDCNAWANIADSDNYSIISEDQVLFSPNECRYSIQMLLYMNEWFTHSLHPLICT